MKYFVQFQHKVKHYKTGEEVVQDALGDSAVFILDGRSTLRTMIVDALNRLEKMNHPNWNHRYCSFTINRGDFRSFTELYRSEIKDQEGLKNAPGDESGRK